MLKLSKSDVFHDLSVTIIVPAKNEAKNIVKCIVSLLNQDYAGRKKIIVVDNNSTDDTNKLAKNMGVAVVRTSATSAAAVRNFGASLANSDVLAFIDGDCVAPVNWLSVAVSGLIRDHKVAIYGGGCFAPESSSHIVRSWASTASNHSRHLRIKNKLLAGSNMILFNSVFIEIYGFNEKLITGEDDDLCNRIINHGYDIIYDTSINVVHFGYPDTLRDVFNKSIWHGSTQIQAHGFFGDKMVSLTILWIVFLLLSLFTLYHKNFFIMVWFAIIIPFFLVKIRLKSIIWKQKIKYIPSCYAVCFVCLSGRAIGLIKEVAKLFYAKKINKSNNML